MKATIVSFIMWDLREQKPGVIPGDYPIPKSDGKTPTVLVITDAITNIYMGHEMGTFPSPVPVEQLANSIVNDYVNSNLEIQEDARPAMFWVEGSHTPEEVLKKFPEKCQEALRKQLNWFAILVRAADDAWARTHQHRAVSDLQRIAARALGMTKEWSVAPEPVTLIKCPACTIMVESTAIICKNCKAILNPEAAKKMNIQFVGAGA